jgi:hypothetical protein
MALHHGEPLNPAPLDAAREAYRDQYATAQWLVSLHESISQLVDATQDLQRRMAADGLWPARPYQLA